MQAEYPKKISPTYWDRVHIQPRVRKFPDTGESSEASSRRWRPPPEVLQRLKPPVPEITYYDRDYTVTNQLTRSQTSQDFVYKSPERHRFNKHTAWAKNEYIYPPSRRPMIEPSWHKDLEPLHTTHEGYEKYLDPYLTTSRLHHRPYTTNQLTKVSVTKDIVTYHTLSKEPWVMADSTTGNLSNVNVAVNNLDDALITPEQLELLSSTLSQTQTSADPVLAELGKQLQKFREDGLRHVRYAETNQQIESTTPTCALHVNPYLESFIPKCKSFEILQNFDQTLATITHGLLKQKKLLQDALDSLPAEVKDAAINAFASSDSQYKKISEDLLQYVSGLHAQVIQQRREMFKPRNMGVRRALYAIPPSEFYLFAEPRLTELVEALPDRLQLAPNTDKCKCCRVHKQKWARRHYVSDSCTWKKKKRRQ